MPSFSQAPPAMVSSPMTEKVTHVDNIQYEKVDLLFDVEMISNQEQQTQEKGMIHVDLFVELTLFVDDDQDMCELTSTTKDKTGIIHQGQLGVTQKLTLSRGCPIRYLSKERDSKTL